MRAFSWGMAAVLFGLALLEVSMQPTWPERLELGLIFLLMTISMGAAAKWLPVAARRNRSIKVTVAVLSLAAFSIVILGALAVGNRMFLSSHDLNLLLVVIAFGLVSAIGFALAVSGPLTRDLDKLSTSAGIVATGDLSPHLDLDRQDEIGQLSLSLNRMVTQLEDAETARREFFSAVGHDLRTPISSIRASVESIRDGVAEDPDSLLQAVERDISILSNLVEDIFLLAKLDSGVQEVIAEIIDVTEIADETLEVCRPVAARRGVQVIVESAERLLANGDSRSLGRALRNLVDNAVRHAPDGSVVTVAVQSHADAIHVEVRDEGHGFDDEFAKVAFERFTRSESDRGRSTGGSGLGLAIAKGLIETMDGSIWIDAKGPGGSVVLELPAIRPERPDLEAPRRSTSSLHPA